MAITLTAEITNEGRKKMADMMVKGRSFLIEQFVSGSGGHDPANPTVALTPDVATSSLYLQSFGPKDIFSKSLVTNYQAKLVCKLASAEAVGVLSNIGLIARINYSPTVNDPDLNTKFLFAVANMPMQNKLAGEEKEFQLTINY